jgi:hypothetical protein
MIHTTSPPTSSRRRSSPEINPTATTAAPNNVTAAMKALSVKAAESSGSDHHRGARRDSGGNIVNLRGSLIAFLHPEASGSAAKDALAKVSAEKQQFGRRVSVADKARANSIILDSMVNAEYVPPLHFGDHPQQQQQQQSLSSSSGGESSRGPSPDNYSTPNSSRRSKRTSSLDSVGEHAKSNHNSFGGPAPSSPTNINLSPKNINEQLIISSTPTKTTTPSEKPETTTSIPAAAPENNRSRKFSKDVSQSVKGAPPLNSESIAGAGNNQTRPSSRESTNNKQHQHSPTPRKDSKLAAATARAGGGSRRASVDNKQNLGGGSRRPSVDRQSLATPQSQPNSSRKNSTSRDSVISHRSSDRESYAAGAFRTSSVYASLNRGKRRSRRSASTVVSKAEATHKLDNSIEGRMERTMVGFLPNTRNVVVFPPSKEEEEKDRIKEALMVSLLRGLPTKRRGSKRGSIGSVFGEKDPRHFYKSLEPIMSTRNLLGVNMSSSNLEGGSDDEEGIVLSEKAKKKKLAWKKLARINK